MKNRLFNSVPVVKPKKNLFDLSHEVKLSCNMAQLIPFYSEDIVPGDKIKINTEILLRMAPLASPVMHRVNVYTHFFAVPKRLVFKNWNDYLTGGEDGVSEATMPNFLIEEQQYPWYGPGTLSDYLGVPDPTAEEQAGGTEPIQINALYHRAYHMIYNEYYRDENLQEKIAISDTDTVSTEERVLLTQMRYRAWQKDYYTSALPWAQKGGEVGIPVDFNYQDVSQVRNADGSTPEPGDLMHGGIPGGNLIVDGAAATGRIENLEEEGVSVTINELRKATQLQAWLESNARGGTRINEMLLNLFGEKNPDSRLQRPEYLGGGKSPIVISEVLNQAGPNSDGTTQLLPLGEMGGHGLSVSANHGFNKRFSEHMIVMGIMSVMPTTGYMQGIPKRLIKFDRYDEYFRHFAHLGEQEVLNKEVYTDFVNGGTWNEQTFGFTPRYAEYKFRNDTVHGDFKTTLKHWHMARIFETPPGLNEDFVQGDPTTRIFAVDDEGQSEQTDKLYVQIYNNIKAIRPMPVFGVPKL